MSSLLSRTYLTLAAASAVAIAFAANDAEQADSPDSANDTPPQEAAQNDSVKIPVIPPLVKWSFDTSFPGKLGGKAKVAGNGPQAPMYPSFAAGNKALDLEGGDGSIQVKETDLPGVNLRFTQGETITIESWVRIDDLKNGSYIYLIGKGRNRNKDFTAENQNWALRLKNEGGEALPTFLFRSRNEKTKEEGYHRWVAAEGFTAGSGWHHVAVTYTFGKPDSVTAYVDGKKIKKGTWDMAGKTTEPPVSDADDVMIGTGNGGGKGNTLNGSIDEIAVYRGAVADATLSQRYVFVPPPAVVEVAKIPAGKILVQICENVPPKNSWPAIQPPESEHYEEDVFGFFELPHKYVDTGVREDRPIPSIMRASAKVELPAGKHRLLVRARSSSRLHIDGKQLILTSFTKADSGGHNHVSEQDKFLDLGGADYRFAPPGTEEAWCEFETKGGEHVVSFETMIGGVVGNARRRPEVGEAVVAISYQGTDTWELLSPGSRKVAYTDKGWAEYETERRAWLKNLNQKRRAEARAKHAAYWDKRRDTADKFLGTTPEIPVPAAIAGYPEGNDIDRFINQKIDKVAHQYSETKKEGVNFHKEVMPILETKCFSCHQGNKTKGDLKLHTLEHAIKGGKSDGPAITPGHSDKSSLYARIIETDEDYIMPPTGDPLSKEQQELIKRWIDEGANWPELNVEFTDVSGLSDDLAFLRRVSLDTIGVPPTVEEIDAFTKSTDKDKRAKAIDRLLADDRWADKWMGYWQDALAENPNMLNPTLNNTGPFRWWIHESLLDDKPLDLFVTELVRMNGSNRFGGPAGFGVASGNDVPMAQKGTIVSTAFLGIEMKCARCHDAPAHESTQEQLFQLAAMLETKPVGVPATSSVPMDKLSVGGRKPLIKVTLPPGSKVTPAWPFANFVAEDVGLALAEDQKSTRDVLAALITAPQNERFAQVMANRIWKQFMGRGIVEPVEDWEKNEPTHPELLKWLGRELVRQNYSMKNLARVILNSNAYQRAIDTRLRDTSPLYTSPAPRRLDAETIVDSLFASTGKPFRTEEVSLDIDGRRDLKNSISLGKPTRAWMLTSTSNERDRPSLALPRIQAVADVLEAFGWKGARQDATNAREISPNALQPAIISNGTMGIWLTRLSDDHGMTELALKDQTVDQLLDEVFLRILTRKPNDQERAKYSAYLTAGYDTRVKSNTIPVSVKAERRPEKYVSWSNHLDAAANVLRHEQQLAARAGDPPTERLDADWRQRMEDVLWAVLNSPELVFNR
jgi:hypothetical protein